MRAALQTLEGHSSLVTSVAFSPDSKLVVSGSDDETVTLDTSLDLLKPSYSLFMSNNWIVERGQTFSGFT
jgi:WD40 repeat protein